MALTSQLASVIPSNVAVSNVGSIDQLISSRAPQALNILQQGSDEQVRLLREGRLEASRPLEALIDNRAFEEQQALLGLQGQAAQEQAIGNIPVSQFDQELQRRQRQQLLRGASARGEIGSGATLESAGQLAGAQQANLVSQRLAQLEPAAALQRGLRGALSQIGESGLSQQAQTQLGLGTQLANIRLGATAPQIQGIQEQAELSGLRGIAAANRKNQQQQQILGLAGSFFGGF